MKIILDDHHGIGDVAMFLSVLDSIKKEYPESEIHMLIKSPVERELVEAVGGVSKFYYYDPLNHNWRSIAKLIIDLRSNHYDLGICHIGTNAKFGSLLMLAIGCKCSVGATSGKRFPNYSLPVDTSIEPRRARKNALLPAKIGIKEIREISLLKGLKHPGNVTKEIRSKFADDPLIGVCIGTGNTVIGGVSVNGKKWPDDSWLELIHKFNSRGYKVLVFGGNKEKKERDTRFDDLPADCVMDFTGKLRLSETLEAIENCDLIIAADTGLGFCAALMDLPTLSLLGPSGPDLAAPYGKNAEYIFLGLDCSPCYGTERMRDCDNRKCMNQIAVDMVFEKGLQMISKYKKVDGLIQGRSKNAEK